jgi:mono/diheme cytochrome c family protein
MRWITRAARAILPAAGALAVLPLASAAQVSFASNQDNTVTFARDVMPILQQNCQICHQPGAIGPMSLMSYEEVRPWAQVISLRVVEREMPPYHYDTNVGIQQLKHDRRLKQSEIETIARWVEQGAPLGNLADMPPPVQWPDASEWRLAESLGRPDHVISSTPFTVPADGQDLWHKPIVESGLTERRCIKAIEVKPRVDGRAATHHANPYWRFPDENGVVQIVGPGGESITEYALGKLGEVVPGDACRVVRPGAMVGWDIHYYPSGDVHENHVVDLGLWFHEDEPKYEQTLRLYPLQGGIDMIPPHGKVMTQGFHTFQTPVRIDSFQPHGHLRLAAKSLEILYQDGKREVVSMISNWNPGWHLSHIYEEDYAPLMPVGAVMIITAWYDNSEDNPHNPDPDQWVGRGNRTTDEMSHGWIAITHLDQEGYDRILAQREAKRAAGQLATERD